MNIDGIFVPQGAEYQSVCRGLSKLTVPVPPVFPIPVGSQSVIKYLESSQAVVSLQTQPQPKVLLMGLCGSLQSNFSIGNIVIYKSCVYGSDINPELQLCDPNLINLLHSKLKPKASLVKSLTSDRLIFSADEKRHLNTIYDADVVDMEGFAALDWLTKSGFTVGMVRVVSDDSEYNIPDLSSALSKDGSLQSLPLAIGMIREPRAAIRLIRGSLKGLKVLQEVTNSLFIK